LKGHGLLEREGRRYAYRLSTKGVQVALLFLFLPQPDVTCSNVEVFLFTIFNLRI
jgi:hypothetical protein